MTSNRQRRDRKNARRNDHAAARTGLRDQEAAAAGYDPARVIEAVRDLLATFPMPSEGTDPAQNSEFGELTKMVRTKAWKISQDQSPLVQYQSLAILAGTIRWFGAESGRPETEILEVLAANFRHSDDHWQQEFNDFIARMRNSRVNGEPPETDHQT